MIKVAPGQVDIALVLACESGNLEYVKKLIEEMNADVCYQDPESGMSVLMAAAGFGHVEVVKYLLSEGAPWNAVDRKYLCAGDYAAKNGHQKCIDALMDHAVMAELLLGTCIIDDDDETAESCAFDSLNFKTHMDTDDNEHAPGSMNASYLASRLEYNAEGDTLIDTQTQLAVMMDWETPLMTQHAAWICHADCRPLDRARDVPLTVLNVGFGMGIVDREIQKHHPSLHVIIEAHSEVLEKMCAEQWHTKPNVHIVSGRWQDAVKQLHVEVQEGRMPKFDGIFFDTYAEDDSDLKEFHKWLPKLLQETSLFGASRYSYYNGVCPDNVFFHGVACETIRLQLRRIGIECTFEPIKVDVSDDKLWKDVAQRYWYFDTYFLPKGTYHAIENGFN